MSPARLAAFEILERIALTSSHSDDLLHGPRLSSLSQADRDLTTALVLGVLRWQIALDARVRPLLSRPDAEIAQAVAVVLRLGAFQLLHMDRIPAHAALNESVELIRSVGHPHAAGMVNAVLRKLVGASPPRRPLVESVEALAERLGHPSWLVEGWVAQYGRAAAESICHFNQHEPECSTLFSPADDQSGVMPLMDSGSRLVAELAAVAGDAARRVWDCCAAPGGKTIVLANRLPAAEIVATDLSPVRLKRLQERLARTPGTQQISTHNADAASLPKIFGQFDLILCDVPCSGTGTLARNPEIRHRLRGDDLRRHAERQFQILTSAMARLAIGGHLVYSTCSLEAEECELVVQRVLDQSGGRVQLQSMGPFLAELKSRNRIVPDPVMSAAWLRKEALRTLPGAGFQGDGFFAVVLEHSRT